VKEETKIGLPLKHCCLNNPKRTETGERKRNGGLSTESSKFSISQARRGTKRCKEKGPQNFKEKRGKKKRGKDFQVLR